MVQDPHVPGTLEWDIRHIHLYGRQQKFCCLREYREQGCQDSGTAREMILGDHAAHLVSESLCIPRQDLRVQMPYGSASHTILRGWLLPRILVKPLNRGESPLRVLEGKGKSWPGLQSPWLEAGMFQGPGPLEFGLSTCFNLFGPSLAVSHSTCLHRSRCVRAGGTSDRSLLHRGLLGRSLLSRSGSHPNARPTWAHHGAFGPPVRLLSRLAWLRLWPPRQQCPNQMGALLDLALFDQQPVEVAPSLNPEGELQEVV